MAAPIAARNAHLDAQLRDKAAQFRAPGSASAAGAPAHPHLGMGERCSRQSLGQSSTKVPWGGQDNVGIHRALPPVMLAQPTTCAVLVTTRASMNPTRSPAR